jgi:ABC-2 type transport system ATP-binding protein
VSAASNVSAAGDPIISVDGIVKRYNGVTAVDGISFQVQRGEIFGMLGPNGAGKTTTVEILEGMRVADSGTAFVNGIDVKRDPKAVKSIIGVQLQSVQFFDQLRLHELVSLFGSLYGRRVDARGLLARVDLTEKQDALYKTLSGGQKQRLSVAVALVNDPVILFLDEPTTGLDPQARRHMWELVNAIRSTGTTVMLTTHYMEEAEELCDRVAIVDSGKIVRIGPPGELIDELIATGFTRTREVREATLEDVFINLTGRNLREPS